MIKDVAYIINLDEYKSLKTIWIVFSINDDNVTYSESLGVEYVPKNSKIHRL